VNQKNERPGRLGERLGPEKNIRTQPQDTAAPRSIQLRGKVATAAKRAARAAATEQLLLDALRSQSPIHFREHRRFGVSCLELLAAAFALQRRGLAVVDPCFRQVELRKEGTGR
jgi:hypothetical protein